MLNLLKNKPPCALEAHALWSSIHTLACLLCLSLIFPALAVENQVWFENFDDGAADNRWFAENGTWQIGSPNRGPSPNPSRTYSGANCATTGLTADYPAGTDTRLVRIASFQVPPAEEFPRLRFWHWFNFGGHMGGVVEIRVVGAASAWTPVSVVHSGYHSSGVWTRPSIDLRSFAGKSVQVGFRLHPLGPFVESGPGWYIDDVALVTGTPDSQGGGFEGGLQDWHVENGTWQVGVPVAGPPIRPGGSRAFAGTSVAATVLAGHYAAGADSRLVTPEFLVPPANEFPRYRFWHWFSFGSHMGGTVEIRRTTGAQTGWVALSAVYSGFHSSGVWTRPSLDLRPYAGQKVQLAFRIHALGPFIDALDGWFIDEPELLTGEPILRNPETWENGLGDWSAETGTWEVGVPTSGPPANPQGNRAYSGVNVAATVLARNYAAGADSRLVSPPFLVADASKQPGLRFRHWHSFGSHMAGVVEIRTGTGPWATLSPTYAGTSGAGLDGWTFPFLSLSPYSGRTVQIAFRILATGPFVEAGPGWYLDDVLLVSTDDSDGDGLADAWETEYFGDLRYRGSDDPDADGLDNTTEFHHRSEPGAGACLNPAKNDTDDDGYTDRQELAAPSDPCDPLSKPVLSLEVHLATVDVEIRTLPGRHYELLAFSETHGDWVVVPPMITGDGNLYRTNFNIRQTGYRFFKSKDVTE